MGAFADLFGLTIDEVDDLLRTEKGRQALGLTESVPIEIQIRQLVGKDHDGD